jgi:CRP-like cAMP-binding protein
MQTQSNPLLMKFKHLPLTAEEKTVLQGACFRTVHFGAREDIVRQGDKPKECNLLLEGVVCRYEETPEGKRQIMSFQFPGDIFDAQSFVLETMDHSIGTITPCKVGAISHQTMDEIVHHYPRLMKAIWKDTLLDAAVFRKWLVNIGRRDAYQRIAHLMCEVFIRLETVGLTRDDHTIDWPFTQAEIADALGLSLVHVNRTLQELRREKLIVLRNPTLTILDWEALKSAGQFAPNYLQVAA